MSKKAVTVCSILVILTLTLMTQNIEAQVIQQWGWQNPLVTSDMYHGAGIVAYEQGDNAILMVQIYNSGENSPFKVKVHMDWATTNQTSDEVEVDSGQFHTFEVSVAVPAPPAVSSYIKHSYRIYYEYERTVGGVTMVQKILIASGNNFVILTSDQTDAINTKREVDAYQERMGGSIIPLPWTAEGRQLDMDARVSELMGDTAYRQGDFSEAKTHYGNALNSTKSAISSDMEKTSGLEDSLIGLVDSVKNMMAMQSYAFIMFGLGFLLISIGILIYLARRSRPPSTM